MTETSKITACRERLDRSLAASSLSSEESIRHLVRSQLTRSPFPGSDEELSKLVANRSEEMHDFVDMMRSASSDGGSTKAAKASAGGWKMKQDTDQVRIMYREGPQGSPFHTMLVEGFADGPIDVCLCVAYEVPLFKKWWPHFSVPPFKVLSCSSLTRVGVGEDISLLRLKLPWPLSDREALLQYITLEFLEEDFIFILIKAHGGGEVIELSKHGFTDDGIPPADEVVRVEVVGGVALQKISPTRCYFRAILNLDLKIDFLPPSLINFVARQLIGTGYKLFQKAIASAKNDDDFSEALKGKLYTIVRGEATLPPSESSPMVLKTQLCSTEAPSAAEMPQSGVAGKIPDNMVSPEVGNALSMVDQIIGQLRDFKARNPNYSSPVHSAYLAQESRNKEEEELGGMKRSNFNVDQSGPLTLVANGLQEKRVSPWVNKANGATGKVNSSLVAVKPMKERRRGRLPFISCLYPR